MRRFLAAALVAFGLVGLFVALAGVLGPHLRPLMMRPSEASSTSEYVGDWESETLSLDLKISGEGQQLSVSGLDASPVTFVRDNDRLPFLEKGGERQLRCKYRHLTLTLADGKEHGFRLRE